MQKFRNPEKLLEMFSEAPCDIARFPYWEAIEILMYLMIGSRLDIALQWENLYSFEKIAPRNIGRLWNIY